MKGKVFSVKEAARVLSVSVPTARARLQYFISRGLIRPTARGVYEVLGPQGSKPNGNQSTIFPVRERYPGPFHEIRVAFPAVDEAWETIATYDPDHGGGPDWRRVVQIHMTKPHEQLVQVSVR